jgi:hypothetical protein
MSHAPSMETSERLDRWERINTQRDRQRLRSAGDL